MNARDLATSAGAVPPVSMPGASTPTWYEPATTVPTGAMPPATGLPGTASTGAMAPGTLRFRTVPLHRAAGPGAVPGDGAAGRGTRGSASVLVALCGCAVVMLGAAVALADKAIIARQRAQVAADLGALAGARYAMAGAGSACPRAAVVVEENHATLAGCHIDGLDLIVTVTVGISRVPGAPGAVRASARAGPVRAGVTAMCPGSPTWLPTAQGTTAAADLLV